MSPHRPVQSATPAMMRDRSLIHFLVVAAAYWAQQADAFVPSSPTSSMAVPRISHQPLFVVADVPNMEEEMEKLNGDDDHDDDDKAWVKTQSGGFLPRIPSVIREKIGRAVKPEQVLTIQEYKAVVADEKERMVCVRFFAPWCKACKAVQQPFYKLCRDYHEIVKFVEVPLTKENAFLHEGLGVPSLPYGHIYHPEAGLVEEKKIKKKEFAEFARVLETYIQGECLVEYPEGGICRQATGKAVAPEP